ncbi:MAG: PLP-dependent aminotransferase family protein [Oscillospiraceae bacterium]|nr:PLP-dependent aminotransferase family protein [Oscillospiraceae bacterium]
MRYSDLGNGLKDSGLGELLALAGKPEMYNFSSGFPAEELFPLKELEQVNRAILQKEGKQAVQYGSSAGYLPLREQIAARMNKIFHADCSAEQIFITSGSQQGLSLLGQLFLDKDDVVLVESPTYLGAINAFQLCGPKFVEVPTDEQGIIPEALEEILRTTERVKMMYVIPEFQNPTGVTWTMERRRAVMEIVNRYDFPVLEDNPYGELRYDGETMPALKSMDTKGNVIFLGSFSKILMPGLRVGWIVAEPEILEKLNLLKQDVDLQCSSFAQRQVSYFMDMFDLDAHVIVLKERYRKRRTLLYDSIQKYFPAGVTATYPEGGLFLWVTLPEGMDAKALAPKATARKVAYGPGAPFYPNGGHGNHLRLNFSTMQEDRIVEGIQILGDLLLEELEG